MATYYVYSGAAGSNNGSSWANAFTTLATAFVTEVAGDTLYVAHDHNEATSNPTLTSSGSITNPTKVICVNRAGSVPPVSADRLTTAQVSSTTNTNLTLEGCTHYDGVKFTAGAGSTSSANLIMVGTDNTYLRFDNCVLGLGITGASGSKILAGGTSGNGGGTQVELNNTPLSFASTASTTGVSFVGKWKWRNTVSALIGAQVPTNLFTFAATQRGGFIECIGVDLSAMGSGKNICNIASASQGATARFVDCKLDAAVTKSTTPTGHGAITIDFIRSGASGVNYNVHHQDITGTLTEETTIVRTGGASDGTTSIAWKVVTTTWCNYTTPFECPPIAIWNDTTGSSKTATVEGIWGGGAVPNDDDIWLDVEYLGSSSTPQGSFVNDGKANLLATAAGQTSSSATWGGSTTKFKLEVTFTPQQKGWVYARVKCAKVSSTFYIDPKIVLS